MHLQNVRVATTRLQEPLRRETSLLSWGSEPLHSFSMLSLGLYCSGLYYRIWMESYNIRRYVRNKSTQADIAKYILYYF